MKNVKFDWITIIVLISSCLATLTVYPQIPEIIPRGWNLAGEVTGMGPKIGILITVSGITVLFLLFNSLGYMISMNKLAGIAIGAMFIPFGNHMPQLKQNAFVGIRTPWTLRDSDTWKATHKLGGYTTVISGVILIILSLLLEVKYIMTVCLLLVMIWAFFTVAYSYYYFMNKHKNTQA